MENSHHDTQPDPSILVIFGAGGDLAWRKLVPALFNLYLDHWLPEHFAIIGLDLKEMSDEEFRAHLRDGIDRFSRRGKPEDEVWNGFSERIQYMTADFTAPETYTKLADMLSRQTKEWGLQQTNYIFYQATPPRFVPSRLASTTPQSLPSI